MSFTQKTFRAIGDSLNTFARGVYLHRKWPLGGAAVGCAGALTTTYLIDWGVGAGPSMYPTIPDHKHWMIIDKRQRLGRGLRIGDIVQADNPQFPNAYVGKRVIGLPGDYVVKDPEDAASVGGAVVEGVTDWRKRSSSDPGSEEEENDNEEEELRKEPEMIQVPEGHVWLAGDNIAWSRDSRTYGPVPMGLITGKTISVAEGVFSWTWVAQGRGRGMRKVEDWEMDAVLGLEADPEDRETSKREKQRVAAKSIGGQPMEKSK